MSQKNRSQLTNLSKTRKLNLHQRITLFTTILEQILQTTKKPLKQRRENNQSSHHTIIHLYREVEVATKNTKKKITPWKILNNIRIKIIREEIEIEETTINRPKNNKLGRKKLIIRPKCVLFLIR